MMQAVMNPLLSIAGAGTPDASAAVAGAGTGSPTGFAALFTSVSTVSAVQNGAAQPAPANGQNPLLALLEKMQGLLKELSETVAELEGTEGVPEGAAIAVSDTLADLTKLVEGLANGEPVDLKSLVAVLPEGLADALAETQNNAVLEAISPVVLIQAVQQAVQNALAGLSDLDGFEQNIEPAKFAAISSALSRLLTVTKPSPTGAHPVSIAANVTSLAGSVETALPGAPIAQTSQGTASASGLALTGAQVELETKPDTANALRAFVVPTGGEAQSQTGGTPGFAAGAFEIPRELVQVTTPEAVSLATVTETQEVSQQMQVQQAARSADAPQAKFSQAVVGQLRAVEFQEGTTRVELNPRGLGNIELELKTNSDGSLSVVVRAENAHVLNSLRDERDLLAQIIGQSGEASVDFQEFASDDGAGFQQQTGSEHGTGSAGTETDDDSTGPTETTTIGGGQLDLMT